MRTPPSVRWRRAVALPPGSFLQATVAGEETLARWCRSLQGANRSPIFSAASARLRFGLPEIAGHRFRQRRRRDRGAQQAAINAGSSRSRPSRATCFAGRCRRNCAIRRRRVRPAAPGRAGAGAQLAASKIATVVAVSCNVATFARDAKILIEGGYEIEGSRRSTSSVIRPTSSWWRGSHAFFLEISVLKPCLLGRYYAPSGPARSFRRSCS